MGRVYRGVYFFEWFAIANLLAAMLFLRDSLAIYGPLFGTGSLTIVVLWIVGIAVRSVIAVLRRQDAYFRTIRSAGWLTDSIRLMVFGAITSTTYSWIKLVVPLYHRTLYDRLLWRVDQALFLGYSPNILFLDLFSNPLALRVVDVTYTNIFFPSMIVASAFFLSEPSRRLRVAFMNGDAALWLVSAWIYLAVPSLGPAYRFPEVWFVHDQVLRTTQYVQGMLMQNYQSVFRAAAGLPHGPINRFFGIAAFPSLHVAFQLFVFLWMRRVWRAGELLFGIFLVLIFFGSIITGWHYAVDSIAGLVIGAACYLIPTRAARVPRFFAIKNRSKPFFEA